MLAISHTHYSLQLSTIKPNKLAKKAKELGYNSVAITDYSSVAGCVEFCKACNKNNIKPVLGCKINISRYPVKEDWIIKETGCDAVPRTKEEKKLDILTVLAKNITGWRSLLKIVTKSNSEECFSFKTSEPRIDIPTILEMDESGEISCDDLIFISGGLGSSIQNNLFYNGKLVNNSLDILKNEIDKYRVFNNFYLGLENSSAIDEQLLSVFEENNIKYVNVSNSHYLTRNECVDHRVLLTVNTNSDVNTTSKHPKYKHFFESSEYFLDEPIENMLSSELFEEYNILSEPKLPTYKCPNSLSDEEYLVDICRDGYKKIRENNKLTDSPKIYGDRVKKEMKVISEYNLSSYFLIIWDLIKWCNNQGWMHNVRGSAAGSLVSYLIGITYVDPLKYDLLFERFMNEGRMSKDRISLPDIDTDIPSEHRTEVINYLKEKYGHKNVAQLATFGRLQGRASLKAVLRANNACSPLEMDAITKHVPDEAQISDELAEMDEDKRSIIYWSLLNVEEIHGYAKITNNEIVGDYAEYFKQAIRLEGVFSSMGKHAAAVILCNEPIVNCAPLIQDSKHEDLIVGVEMSSAEDMGLVKLDILGLSLLSKLMYINKILMGEV